MLEWELYLVIAISTGSSISWVDTVFFPVSSIPSEFVILTKYSLKVSATGLSMEIISLFSSKVTLAEVLIVPEKRSFTVFENLLNSSNARQFYLRSVDHIWYYLVCHVLLIIRYPTLLGLELKITRKTQTPDDRRRKLQEIADQ